MSDVNEMVDNYLAAWNEQDPQRRAERVEAVFTTDATYVDPMVAIEGRDAITATIGAVQAQFPDLRFRRGGPVDAHHDRARFTWELAPEGGEAIVVGFDVAVLAGDGRIREIHGFLDKLPAGPSQIHPTPAETRFDQ